MKTFLLTTIAFLVFAITSKAQWTAGTGIITTTNNVGIGTTSPSGLFNVVVPGAKTASTGNIASFLSTNEAGASNPFGLRTMIFGGSAIVNRYATLQTTDLNLADGGSIVLQPATGSVGIGTITPKSVLHVNGTTTLSGNSANLYPFGGTSDLSFLANSGQVLIGWNRSGSSGETDFIANQGAGGTGGFAFYNHDNTNSESQLMFIRGDGNVGIGTADPKGYKFAVNGSAIATSMTVKLYASWPDYVFRPTYQIPSLTAVKTFIDQNHHLPDMPTAAEVERMALTWEK